MSHSKSKYPGFVDGGPSLSRSFIRRQYFTVTSASDFTETQAASAIGRKRAHNRLGWDDFGAYDHENDDD